MDEEGAFTVVCRQHAARLQLFINLYMFVYIYCNDSGTTSSKAIPCFLLLKNGIHDTLLINLNHF